ncbi:UNVERIFIED_CONTAM: hypothetical protein LK11_03915 [Mumia flava]
MPTDERKPVALIALASSADLHDHPEVKLLAEALAGLGHEASVETWDDESVDWHRYALTVVRTTWDYTARRDEFLAWARAVPRLRNRADVLAWNTDKTYLRDLDQYECPVVPTAWDVDDSATVEALADHLGVSVDEQEWVVKPTISAGSRDTGRWSSIDDAVAHSRELLAAGRPTMLQPYVEAVDAEGETALLYVGGTLSHTMNKSPLLAPGEGVPAEREARKRITTSAASPTQTKVAEKALRAARKTLGGGLDLLYARVDVVTGPDGSPQVLELELTEPSMFVAEAGPEAAERLAGAISTALTSVGRA